MSGSARFVFPKLKLEQLMRAPGGLPVVEALAAAEANLETLRPTCLAELMALLVEAETAFARLGPDAELAVLDELYRISVRGIGSGAVCGAPDVDDALGSLCDLVDQALTGGSTNRDAFHAGSIRLPVNTRPLTRALVAL